jgi:hypothetical protein
MSFRVAGQTSSRRFCHRVLNSVRMHIPRLAAIVALATVLRVAANDTTVTLGAGGLIPARSSAIVMESEDLQISVHQITVKYVFRNTGSHDLDLMVAFPLPEIDGGAAANVPIDFPSRDPLNFVDFEVFVAGRKIAPKTEVRSFFNGSEITSELRSLGLPLSALDANVAAAMKKLTVADRSRVEKNGWVDCSVTNDGRCWPYWQSRIQFYWTQHFKAGTAVDVTHTYHPVVGGGAMYGGGDIAAYANYFQGYCPRADALDQIKRKLSGEKFDGAHPVLRQREIQYILTTANNWSGPIRSFHLSVISDSPEDVVATCLPNLTRVTPARYELLRSNFRPDREIELLVLQAAK